MPDQDDQITDERAGTWRKWGFCLLFAVLIVWCMGSPSIPNATSRLALTFAMAQGKAPTIDEVAPIERDRAFFEGHYYSDKAPGVSILSVPGVVLANIAARPLNADDHLIRKSDGARTVRYYLTAMGAMLLVLIPLSVAGAAAFRQALLDAGVAERIANAGTIAMACGTPYFIWSALPLGHATAAALLVMGFGQYWALRGGTKRPTLRLFGAGFLLALAVLVEFIAAPASIAIGVLILWGQWSVPGAKNIARTLGLMAAGGLIPALMLLSYNYSAFGSPLHLGYSSVDGWEGMRQGFFGISFPDPAVLWAITFGTYRGVFWLSPILIPAIWGSLTLLRDPAYRPAGIVILFIAASYFLINSGYFYWDGNYSTGPRHVTPALPFLLFGLALAYSRFPAWLRSISIVAGIYSVLMILLCAIIQKRAHDNHEPMLGEVFSRMAAGEADTLTSHALPSPVVIAVAVMLLGSLIWWVGLIGQRRVSSI